MKCSESNPEQTYQECQRDLGHAGDHEYYSYRWARPEPAEPQEDVEDFLLNAERAFGQHHLWDLHDRDYFVAFEVTTTYLVKVSAESEDAALKQYDDYCDFPNFDREMVADSSIEVRRPTEWERRDHMYEQKLGPEIACPGCGRLSMSPRWFHDPYRKCHGPIRWRAGHNGRAYREFEQTPVFVAQQAVTA